VILVANHRSYFDVFAVAMMVASTGRTDKFLGKEEVVYLKAIIKSKILKKKKTNL
jgi:1-acyl-sn-glycerol-3-phosphate acyltransferase